jgi:hypothetical protein
MSNKVDFDMCITQSSSQPPKVHAGYVSAGNIGGVDGIHRGIKLAPSRIVGPTMPSEAQHCHLPSTSTSNL